MKVINYCCTSCDKREVCKLFNQMSNLNDSIRHISEYPDDFSVTINCKHMTGIINNPREKDRYIDKDAGVIVQR